MDMAVFVSLKNKTRETSSLNSSVASLICISFSPILIRLEKNGLCLQENTSIFTFPSLITFVLWGTSVWKMAACGAFWQTIFESERKADLILVGVNLHGMWQIEFVSKWEKWWNQREFICSDQEVSFLAFVCDMYFLCRLSIWYSCFDQNDSFYLLDLALEII